MNARVRPSSPSGTCRGRTVAALLAASCLPAAAWAQAEGAADAMAAVAALPASALHGGPLVETTTDAPRLDFSEPAGPRLETTRWRPAGHVAYGLALGITAAPSALNPSATVLRPSVGLRFRSQMSDNRRLDVATWQDLVPQREANFAYAQLGEPERFTTTRVEMQFKPPKGSGLGLDMGGAVGFQMSANAKLQLRIRKGGPMVYYRSKF